jgi:DNA polymerase-1
MGARISKRAKDFIRLYSEWQELHTLLTRYIKGFEKSVRSDGRIHSRYSIATAVTGRIASSQPNLQNIPKRGPTASAIRRLICAPPGFLLLAIDAAQSELRWAAHISGDQTMIDLLKRGRDLHTETALMYLKKSE